jgi:subtilisin-like proprotein convertase family protein
MPATMKKRLLFLFFIFCYGSMYAQNDDLWQKINVSSSLNRRMDAPDSRELYYKLNTDILTAKLLTATDKGAEKSTSEITIPNSAGVLERFSVWEASNFAPQLQVKHPEIRAYEGIGLDDKSAKIYFSVAPIGMQTMVQRVDKAIEFIEQDPENKTIYKLSAINNLASRMRLDCQTTELIVNKSAARTAKLTSSSKVFKTMRLALSCTAEYTAYYGGTKAGALAGMNATLARVNAVLGNDLAVKLVLIDNTEDVIYTAAATDPYSDAPTGVNGKWNTEVQATLTSVIGDGNYDIGHLFGASGGGGNAGCIGCVCTSPTTANPLGKGSAYTSPSNGKPQGDAFDIDFVVHEIGHQLGATHTFSYDNEGGSSLTHVEPGSGSSVMGYAGITDGYDIQANSDDYFAYVSIAQIQNNLATKSCPISTVISNNPPTIDAGIDYTIPISTAFVLKGSGSDAEGDGITYNWEENDNATTTSGSNSMAYPTKPDGPLFRSVVPSGASIRYMPSLNTVLQNQLTSKWESVSSIGRTLHFTLTGRDNAAQGTAQTSTASMMVTVAANAGPFVVTSHNGDDMSWGQGRSEIVTWKVNKTNTLQGSSTVNIKLSTDGGLSFPIILAANTPNDGIEVVAMPTTVPSSTACRILIEPTANIYYAINPKSFAVGYTAATSCNSYSFGPSFGLPEESTFTTKTITVPETTGTVSDINVSVNVTHARFGDLEMEMVSPQGTVVRLFNKGCARTNSTLALQFDDQGGDLRCDKTTEQIIIPVDALSVFNGESAQGNWILRVRDAVAGNAGTINAASINICSQVFTLGNTDIEDIDFTLYPNPNKGQFTIRFLGQGTTGIQVSVYDVLGKNVYANTFESATHFKQNIQLPNASSGLYLIKVVDGNRKVVKKIVIN